MKPERKDRQTKANGHRSRQALRFAFAPENGPVEIVLALPLGGPDLFTSFAAIRLQQTSDE
jgi:hypothetical protein